MTNRVYIDTNIAIDMCDETRLTHESSFTMISEFIAENKEIYINTDSLNNLFFILGSRTKLPQSFVLEKMRLITTICNIVSIELKDVEMALDLCEDDSTYFKNYEDTMQYVCAKSIEADLIISNDKGFISLDIEVVKT